MISRARSGTSGAVGVLMVALAGPARAEQAADSAGKPPAGPATPAAREPAPTTTGPVAGAVEQPAATWPALDDPARWTVEIRPRAWYLSPSGDVRLPDAGGTQSPLVKVNDLDLDEPKLEPAGEISLQSGPWRFGFGAATYSTDVDKTASSAFRLGAVSVTPGQTFRTEMDFTTAQVQAGYGLFEHDFGAEDGWAGRTVGRLHVLGGARFYDLSLAFSRIAGGPAARTAEDGFWVEPYVGAHGELQVVRDFSLDLDISGGAQPFGDDTSWSVDLAVAFSWRPGCAGVDGLAVQIGWRQLLFDLQNGADAEEFRFDGGFAGLFFGAVIRF